jgi:hypothetical protein
MGHFVRQLKARGYSRLRDLALSSPQAPDDYCRCRRPDVWVRGSMDGNAYRCGKCGGYIRGMER